MTEVRIQKFLSQAGVCSRRRGEVLIAQGSVSVNGKKVTELGTKINPEKDRVLVFGKPIKKDQDLIYIALNKPAGYESTCRRGRGRIILDLVRVTERIYPVGRLDKDSQGLILLTSDGRLHHQLSHPSFSHEKEYEVETRKTISDMALDEMRRGMRLVDFDTNPCDISRISGNLFHIVLKEGKNRQIRKMVAHTGNEVKRLKRVRIAHIHLDTLAEGKWRYLSDLEIKRFFRRKRRIVTKV